MLLAGLVLGSILTFAYSARFMWGAFAVKPGVEPTPFKPIKPAFLAAPAVLSLLTVLYGLWPAPVDGWIQPYAALFAGGPADAGDAAASPPGTWRCGTASRPALGLTAVTFALGLAMFYGRNAVARLQGLVPGWIDARPRLPADHRRPGRRGGLGYRPDPAWFAVLLPLRHPHRGVRAAADGAAPGRQAAARRACTSLIPTHRCSWWPAPAIVIGALAAVRANKRFLAVLMVSVTGYGIALMFALQGAPDLALTQMLVETIILVAFVLAMRSLPAELRDRTGGKYRVIRVIIGAGLRRHHGLRRHLRPGRPRGARRSRWNSRSSPTRAAAD